jgi:hypothetical protein
LKLRNSCGWCCGHHLPSWRCGGNSVRGMTTRSHTASRLLECLKRRRFFRIPASRCFLLCPFAPLRTYFPRADKRRPSTTPRSPEQPQSNATPPPRASS